MRVLRALFGTALVPLLWMSPLMAQVDSIPGVTLGLLYESEFQPALAVQPFTGRLGGESAASRVEAIIARDLRYSDRFEVMDALPVALVGDEVDYQLWDQLGAVWLVSGSLEGAGSGFVLVLELHDVVYGEVHETGRFSIPDPEDQNFRLAVHIVSDAVIEWIYNEPGMAASRIAFSIRTEDLNQDLYVIDSDGENFRRLTNYNDLTMTPSWSTDGTRIAFSSRKNTGLPRLYELDLETMTEKPLDAGRDGDHNTPIYSPQRSGRDFFDHRWKPKRTFLLRLGTTVLSYPTERRTVGRHFADVLCGWALARVQLQPPGQSNSADLCNAGHGRRGGSRFPVPIRPARILLRSRLGAGG